MASIREQIVQSVLALVNTARPGDVPEIKRSYLYAMDLEAEKIVSLYQAVTRPIESGAGSDVVIRHATVLRFKLGAKGTASTKPDEELDALCVWLVKTLVGKSQLGLYHKLKHGELLFDYEQGDHGYAIAWLDVIAEHQTRADDPEVWA
jgi:hypothetical protein